MLICSLLLYYPEEFRGIARKMVKSVLFLVWSTSPLLMWRQGPHLEHPSALMWAVVWVLCSGALPPPPSLALVFMLLFVPLFSHHLSSTGASFGCFWPFLNAFCGNGRPAVPCGEAAGTGCVLRGQPRPRHKQQPPAGTRAPAPRAVVFLAQLVKSCQRSGFLIK